VKLLHARNITRDISLCRQCGLADNILTRVRGLMWRASLGEDEGLWILPCPSIHMFNMKFALDVVFLTKDRIVTDIIENIEPGKTYVARNQAGKPHSAIEVVPGTVARTGTQIGDAIEFIS
jgi:uncharacterized membrane protein (UPF0127 family)